MLKTITRSEFEGKIGGEFNAVPEAPGRRTNGQWVTYKAHSILVQERMDCFCAGRIKDGPVFSGHTWADVAKAMRIS